MTALVLRFAAPLQSWGTSSRFTRRNTDLAPSRSGVIGLLASACGVRRADDLGAFTHLRVGVRVDQEGQLERDFQTARSLDGSQVMPLSTRFYLADAVFCVAVEGDAELLDRVRAALRRPAAPLFLGRRSCPPAGRLVEAVIDGDIRTALATVPWLASPAVRRKRASDREVTVDVVLDCPPDTPGSDVVRDVPISFDPRHRQYSWRSVHRDTVTIPNPDHSPPPDEHPHDPMELLGSPS
ncbi:type I-E CRISPR-associated protein Cas5/CasD [Actinoalloteichus sp. AHMU CJ021]|uniref:type I-E CRISPR-associated protein Cas5/CasD n=1 Tax=Actinoalloteichus TaxID=65496 RepID=UPI00037E9CF5|nr:type I-E CRISPR-associated protein Cas5/CasD [Actinoalloteichus spitiensis]AUS77102.1 type I-E CRISPR-associated protein Cas5/CasD [Actinoalloteichus sp. AHMU CJ021]